MTTKERKHAYLTGYVLDIIDNSFDGCPLAEIWHTMSKTIDFAVYVRIINGLISLKLITVDCNHIAHRVQS